MQLEDEKNLDLSFMGKKDNAEDVENITEEKKGGKLEKMEETTKLEREKSQLSLSKISEAGQHDRKKVLILIQR